MIRDKTLALALLLLLQAVSAGGVTKTFTYQPGLYITTDLQFNPTVSAPKPRYCTGDQFTPSADFPAVWYTSTYGALLGSNVNVGTCLIPSTDSNQNQSIDFSGSPSLASEASAYAKPNGTPFTVNGNQLFAANIGVSCSATASIVSSNAAYNRGPVAYTGGSIAFPTITLSTPGTYTFSSRLNVGSCYAIGDTVQSGCQPATLTYTGSGALGSFDSAIPASITVENKFSCNDVTVSAITSSPISAVQGQQFTVQFRVSNAGVRSLSVNPNAILVSSGFTRVGVPTIVGNNPILTGGSLTVSVTVTPTNSGNGQTLTITIPSSTTQVDCNGDLHSCSDTVDFTVDVPPQTCTLAFVPPGADLRPGDSKTIQATCSNPSTCPTLAWTHNAGTAASLTTPTAPGTSPQSTLTIASNAQQHSGYQVTAANGPLACTIQFNVLPPAGQPDYIISKLTAPASALTGQSFQVQVRTKNIGTATSISSTTRTTFLSTNNDATIAGLGANIETSDSTYTFICPSTPGTYPIKATADLNDAIDEANEGNNENTIYIECKGQPDYIVQLPGSVTGTVDQIFTVLVTTTNRGNADSTSASVTTVTFNGGTPYSMPVPDLSAGESYSRTHSFTCPSTVGDYPLSAMADANKAIDESNEYNNEDETTVHCGPPAAKPDYIISKLTAPASALTGQSFQVRVKTKNQGTGTAITSTTRTTFQSTNFDTTITGLAANAESGESVYTFICPSTPDTYQIKATADLNDAIDEANEGNNEETISIVCEQPPELTCALGFISHAGTFRPGEFATVQASCEQGGSAVNCPVLSWSQNAQGGSLASVTTYPQANPQNTLTINVSAPTPQTGRAVSASGTGVTCTPAPFDIVQDTTPRSCTLELSSSGLYPGTSATATATCYNSLGQDVNCPAFSWSQTANGGGVSPTNTPAAANPQTNLSILASASAPQSGKSVIAAATSFSCSAPFSVVSQANLTCAFENGHSDIFFQGESAPATATCSVGGTAVPCPTLLWSTQSLSDVTLSPATTTTAPHRSTMHISPTAPVPQSGSVTVQCQNPGQCANTCSMPVRIYSVPTQLNCTLANNHGSLFSPGESATVQGMCLNATSQATYCPPLTWQSSISSYSFTPNPTPSDLNPTTLFYVYPEAPHPQLGGHIYAANSDFHLACSIPVNVNLHGPDYTVTQITFDPSTALLGQQVRLNVTVMNIGNENATNTTITQLTGAGCLPQIASLDKLNAGESYTEISFFCTCTGIGWQKVIAHANIYGVQHQYETTYTNNEREASYFCLGGSSKPMCWDYV